MVELGRSCVHPDWRSGGVILALWGALAEFMHRNALDTMVGCASISMRDGGHCAASLWTQLRNAQPAQIELARDAAPGAAGRRSACDLASRRPR
jgi:putative hemolysin